MKKWITGVFGTIVVLSLVAAVSAKGKPAQTTCPVTGDHISQDVYTNYQGHRIYFCSTDCSAEFTGNPEHYMKRMAAQGALRCTDNWNGGACRSRCGSGSRGRSASNTPTFWQRIWGCWGGANGKSNRGCGW
ncbi:MAG: YHS domain-containing protein [Planctomycetes bacterium]|nr:YHS domain-containing protein [Planctomycetota bacterium]